MWLISLYAAIAVIESALGDGGASIYVMFAALGAALLTEFIAGTRTGRHTVLDGSAAASALVLTLLLPNQIPPVFAALGAVFAIAVVKITFGGLGANWLNPAVSGWLFIHFSWPGAFNGAIAGSPLSFLVNKVVNGGGYKINSFWEILSQNGFVPNTNTITQAFNKTVFSLFGTELPASYLDFFSAPGIGIIGDRGVYALLIGSAVIAALGVSRFYVSAVYLVFYMLLIKIAGVLPTGGGLWEGEVLFGVLTGGTLITAFILLTDPATSPKSVYGKTIFALLAAALTFFFRYMKSDPYGAFFAVALLITFTPLIRDIENRYIYNPVKRRRAIEGREGKNGKDGKEDKNEY
jgi:electron transport complex protein RnfD